jgi:hypothetical protein
MNAPKRFTVGRANTCDIPIAHDSVSRTHAEIELLNDDRLRVRDLGSQNGTALIRQGREFPLAQEVVFLNDTIRFGEVALAAREVFDILKAAMVRDFAERKDGAPAPAPLKPALGSALVRCECGGIKPRAGVCPVCGQ